MTTPNGSDQEREKKAAEAPNRLQQAAQGMAEAQAWKGQRIATGWRKLVASLRRPREGSA
jgi:hypothetical protein